MSLPDMTPETGGGITMGLSLVLRRVDLSFSFFPKSSVFRVSISSTEFGRVSVTVTPLREIMTPQRKGFYRVTTTPVEKPYKINRYFVKTCKI